MKMASCSTERGIKWKSQLKPEIAYSSNGDTLFKPLNQKHVNYISSSIEIFNNGLYDRIEFFALFFAIRLSSTQLKVW